MHEALVGMIAAAFFIQLRTVSIALVAHSPVTVERVEPVRLAIFQNRYITDIEITNFERRLIWYRAFTR